ncbi:MAG: V-type ATPase subunit [Methanomicrobiaceae archaeon]|nr:V-type ATPase subunit [Methanomicrobiaceae archaeon]
MNSRLLAREELDRLMHKPDIDGVISELERSPYRPEIEKASVRYSGIHCIENALRADLARTSQKILRMVRDEPFEKYVRISLNKWDIQNIKTVMRGKNIHVPVEEILECVVPAGELDEATFVELAKKPDVRSVIDLLATWEVEYAMPLTQNYDKFKKKRDLAVLEYALDKFHYRRVLAILKGRSYDEALVRDLVKTEIDITNIKSMLRMIRDGVSPEDGKNILIEGGNSFTAAMLLDLIGKRSFRDALSALATTPYSGIADLSGARADGGNISVLEKELDRFLIRKGIAVFRTDPLSIAVVIGYLWAKNNEITNIRIISRCINAFVPDEEIREELLYV